VQQQVFGSGNLAVVLDAPLQLAGGDLNLERLSSNFIADFVGMGPTGDMQLAVARYVPGGDTEDELWIPTDDDYFPQEKMSHYLDIEVVGAFNAAFHERKPTNRLIFSSPESEMFAGFAWDETMQNQNCDNVGDLPPENWST
jgi:hypothetical protein